MNQQILEKTLDLVYSSTRAMPAHFTSNGDRSQSFCIDFELLDADADYNMASSAYNFPNIDLVSEKISLSPEQLTAVIKCGENVMVGAFIISKLGGKIMIEEMKKNIIENSINTFDSRVKNLENIFSSDAVQFYLNHCVEYAFCVSE
ncbi:MAG: hypothetical protein WCT18_04700 [Patescibacteria group bacterium]